jgi:ankyrin repeat protein
MFGGCHFITFCRRKLEISGNFSATYLRHREFHRSGLAPETGAVHSWWTQFERTTLAGLWEVGVADSKEVLGAIQDGNVEQLRALLAEDAALAGTRDANGVSALMLAIYQQRKDLADALRVKLNAFDIFEASSLGRSDLVEEMIQQKPALANTWSGDGFTPLHFAAFFGQDSVARVLLEHHADVSAVSKNGMKVTPLHSAAAGRHMALVRALLENGAPVNAKQEQSWTALHAAAQNGDQYMVDLLLKYGANPNARNDDGVTPEQLAHAKGHSEIAERLRAA